MRLPHHEHTVTMHRYFATVNWISVDKYPTTPVLKDMEILMRHGYIRREEETTAPRYRYEPTFAGATVLRMIELLQQISHDINPEGLKHDKGKGPQRAVRTWDHDVGEGPG